MKNTPEMVQALLHRGKQRFAAGQFATALDDLDYVRRQQPQNTAVQFFHAGCLLATGDPATAWQEYTQILTHYTAFGQGYAYRAQADALLGDPRRARADLAIAASLRPQDAAKFQAAVDRQLADLKAGAPSESPEALRAALEKSALGGTRLEQLVEQATALHKAVQARSLKEDEVYQQRLKALEDAQRAEPRSVDRLVALAEFLTREAKARNERMVPPEKFGSLQTEIPRDPDGEFARAERLLDEALSIEPNSAPALVAKARLCFVFYQFGDADELLQRALNIQRDVPDGLELSGAGADDRIEPSHRQGHQSGVAAVGFDHRHLFDRLLDSLSVGRRVAASGRVPRDRPREDATSPRDFRASGEAAAQRRQRLFRPGHLAAIARGFARRSRPSKRRRSSIRNPSVPIGPWPRSIAIKG